MSKQARFIALAFAMGFPTLVTLVYFRWLQDVSATHQQLAYGILKTIQFGFPVGWFAFDRQMFGTQSKEPAADAKTGWWLGAGFGLLVVASMFGVYFLWMADTEAGASLVTGVQAKLGGMGLDTFWKFALLGCFYSLGHSFLEEYYWRWFVFRGLRHYWPTWLAVILSGLGFMAHHVVVLGVFLGFDSPLTYFFSLTVAVGGAVWALLYDRYGRLAIPWISHLVVDAGIFSLGYLLIRGSLSG